VFRDQSRESWSICESSLLDIWIRAGCLWVLVVLAYLFSPEFMSIEAHGGITHEGSNLGESNPHRTALRRYMQEISFNIGR